MAKNEKKDDLLTGGSLASEDKSVKKAEKAAAKAKKLREKNEAKRAEIKKQIDTLKSQKANATDEKTIAQLDSKIKKLSDKYTSVGSDKGGIAPRTAKIIKAAVCIVVVVALLCTYVCTGAVRKGFVSSIGIPAQSFTGVTVTNGENNIKLKVATYNYYFAMTYNNLKNTQEMYSQYGISAADAGMDVDFDKKLSSQTTKNHDDEEVTWAQYIHDEALESMENTYTYYLEAVAANNGEDPEITDEQKSELKETVDKYRETAEGYGYTLSAYLVKAMGKGVTEKVFKQEAIRSYIAENYKSQLSEDYSKKEYTKDDYKNYKDEHLDEVTGVDIRIFECSNEDDAKAFKKALKADGSNFSELCSKYADGDFLKKAYAEDGYSTELGATKSALESKGYAFAVKGDDEKTAKGIDWLFSNDRKAGDSYQLSTTVVYVLAPAHLNDGKTVNVRHILIAPKTDDEDTSAKDATDAQWKDAYSKAEKLLNEWKKGDKTEDSFSALVADNTADTGSADNGGLYENVIPNKMVNPFSTWCFENGRKAGDTAIVKSEFGYHIMYFVGYGDLTVWEYVAQQALSSDDNTSATEALEEAYTVKENWFGSRYFQKDVDIDN